jgi:hypothetical protein
MAYDNWRKRLAIAKLPTVAERRAAIAALKINFSQPTLDDEGYYRRPITEAKLGPDGKTNGQKKVVGWEPVSYFIKNGVFGGAIGKRYMAINEVTDEGLWSWVVGNPIDEDAYRAAIAGKPWPDLQLVMAGPRNEVLPADGVLNEDGSIGLIPAANRDVSKSDNAPPEDLPLDQQHATGIDNAIAATIKTVTSEAEAAIALGSKNRLAELRLAADKAGHAIYDPLRATYEAEQKKWPAMVKRADAEEKRLNTAILTFRESERKRIAKEQLEAFEKQQAIDEANIRAADRAIAAGEPEPPPVVETVVVPMAQAPLVAPYRAPGQRAALKEEEKWFLDEVNDYDAVYTYFKNNEILRVTLKTLATAAVRLGQTVPGTKTHKGLV